MREQDGMILGSQHRERRTPVETQVAFFAYVSAHSTHLGRNQDIVFDHVVTNIGNAYNGHHGTFIAPMAGTYVFSVTLAQYKSGSQSSNADAQLVVNGVVVAKFHMVENQATQTIIVSLKAGDDVSTENRDLDDGLYGLAYSTFSGFLLYEGDSVGTIIG